MQDAETGRTLDYASFPPAPQRFRFVPVIVFMVCAAAVGPALVFWAAARTNWTPSSNRERTEFAVLACLSAGLSVPAAAILSASLVAYLRRGRWSWRSFAIVR